MKIEIKNVKNHRQVHAATVWALDRLGVAHEKGNIHIAIKSSTFDDVENDDHSAGRPSTFGACCLARMTDPTSYFLHFNPRCSKRGIVMLSSLFHELIHVSQYASDRMSIYGFDNELRWWRSARSRQGRIYDIDRTAYSRRPWEREARRMEKVLLREWKK